MRWCTLTRAHLLRDGSFQGGAASCEKVAISLGEG
jgi:hypothetical protein